MSALEDQQQAVAAAAEAAQKAEETRQQMEAELRRHGQAMHGIGSGQ
ncbi:hypothetical protein [Streptomyces sp. NPDC088135]